MTIESSVGQSNTAAVLTVEAVTAEIFPVEENFNGFRLARKMKIILPIIEFLRRLDMKTNLGITYIDTFHDKSLGKSSPRFRLEEQGRRALHQVGGMLMDLSRSTDRIILPEAGPEVLELATQAYEAVFTGQPVRCYTPVCPDWSRNSAGVYDFKSLGSKPSYIAQKFLQEAPSFLATLAKHKIPYEGTLVFADWGMETEITARDTYGNQLPQDEIVVRFAQSFQATINLLVEPNESLGDGLFEPFRLQSMTEFLALNLGDPIAVCRQFQQRFLVEERAKKLLQLYRRESFPVNQRRLGLSEAANNQNALQTLSEYATLGAAIKEGIMVVAESRLASLAYNVFRPKNNRLPVVFLKGKASIDQGVNIL